MGLRWHDQKQSPYHAVHEIELVIHQDPKELYFFSNAKTRVEAEANRDAVGILVTLYFDNIDRDEVNIHRFMSVFDIPFCLEDIARDVIAKFYMWLTVREQWPIK